MNCFTFYPKYHDEESIVNLIDTYAVLRFGTQSTGASHPRRHAQWLGVVRPSWFSRTGGILDLQKQA